MATSGGLSRNKSYLGMKRYGWIESLAMIRVESEQDLLEEAINNVNVNNLVNGTERINTIKKWMKENSEKWKETIREENKTETKNVTLVHYRAEGMLGRVADYVTSQNDCIRGRDTMTFTERQLVHVLRVCGLNSSSSSIHPKLGSKRERKNTTKFCKSKAQRRRTISDLGERRYLCHTVDCTFGVSSWLVFRVGVPRILIARSLSGFSLYISIPPSHTHTHTNHQVREAVSRSSCRGTKLPDVSSTTPWSESFLMMSWTEVM